MSEPIYCEIEGEVKSPLGFLKTKTVHLLLFAPGEWEQEIYPFEIRQNIKVTVWLSDGPHYYTYSPPYRTKPYEVMEKMTTVLERRVAELLGAV